MSQKARFPIHTVISILGRWIELTGYTTINVASSQYVYQVLVIKNIGKYNLILTTKFKVGNTSNY